MVFGNNNFYIFNRDVLKNEELDFINDKQTPNFYSKFLTFLAFSLGSSDNISSIAVNLKKLSFKSEN
jgi:hypothetical protein